MITEDYIDIGNYENREKNEKLIEKQRITCSILYKERRMLKNDTSLLIFILLFYKK